MPFYSDIFVTEIKLLPKENFPVTRTKFLSHVLEFFIFFMNNCIEKYCTCIFDFLILVIILFCFGSSIFINIEYTLLGKMHPLINVYLLFVIVSSFVLHIPLFRAK